MTYISKNKYKWIIIILSIIALIFTGRYVYTKYRSHRLVRQELKNQSRFQGALSDAIKIPDSYWDEKYQDMEIKDKYKVVLILTKGGEYTYGEYFKFAAERIGWEVRTYPRDTIPYEQEILNFDPDFILFSEDSESFLEMKLTAHRSKKYVLNFLSFQQMRDLVGIVDKDATYNPTGRLRNHIAMSHGMLGTAKEIDIFRVMFESMNKPFNGFRMLPFVPELINEPAEHNNLMWLGMGWDNFRSSNNYQKFIELLSNNIPMKVYGPYKNFSFLPENVYDGYIGPGMGNIEAIRNNGIYLLTHSDFHFSSGISSMRPFEATAANAIVISDKHPFIVENFGDNFLYFDHDVDAETMYNQVKAHYDWIKSHPEEAKAMADRAHKIFLEKFTLEKDLVRIAKMHEYVMFQEKKMGLNYSLAYQ